MMPYGASGDLAVCCFWAGLAARSCAIDKSRNAKPKSKQITRTLTASFQKLYSHPQLTLQQRWKFLYYLRIQSTQPPGASRSTAAATREMRPDNATIANIHKIIMNASLLFPRPRRGPMSWRAPLLGPLKHGDPSAPFIPVGRPFLRLHCGAAVALWLAPLSRATLLSPLPRPRDSPCFRGLRLWKPNP
ncbi:hypothetical protein VUR80DRAFT_3651 [Thermomyces stellatus]